MMTSKTNNSGKSGSASGKRGSAQAAGERARESAVSESRRQKSQASAARKHQKKVTMTKEIVMILVVGLCVLLFASFFSDALVWLKDISYNLFGILMYCAPLLIAFGTFILLFRELNGEMIRRIIAFLIALFAVSGILSLAKEVPDGGLFGRANYGIFFKLLGKTGSWIVNIILIAVAVVLFAEFSAVETIDKKVGPSSELSRQKKREAELISEQKELLREKRELEKEEAYENRLSSMRNRNLELKEKNDVRRTQLEKNRDRFTPVYGIGDTTIRDTDQPVETTFYRKEDALKQNEKLFSDVKEKKSPSDTPVKASNAQKDVKITVSDSFFSHEDQPSIDLTEGRKQSSVQPTIREAELPPVQNFFEKNTDEESYEGKEEYVKTIVTSTGKIIRHETDGDILKKKLADARKEQTPANSGSSYVQPKDPASQSLQNDLPEIRSQYLKEDNSASESDHTTENVKPEPVAEKAQTKNTAEPIEVPVYKEPKKEYTFPPMRLLKKGTGSGISKSELEQELKETAAKLQQTLATFGVGVTITNISCGPTVTRYEILPEMGVKVSKIVSLTDDIKLNLAAADIRMEAPIPGKSAIGIEIPNKVKQSVVLRDLLETEQFENARSRLAFAAGRDIEGNVIISDIAKMPHVLVAGATGSGKSVCINTVIMSILYHAKPTEVKMIMVDPKVVELSVYNGIPHLLLPVVTDPKKAAGALNWAVAEMERRYEDFARFGVRGIEGFNELIDREAPEDDGGNPMKRMPQILIIVDELADLMMVAPGDVETAIARLAQKARAAGIHLILATQRPSVDVITGLIKANIPSRIAFAVSSGVDSRTILDMNGAEKLLGMGDMLYAPAGSSKPTRLQGAYVSDNEVKQVVDYIINEGNVKGGGLEQNVDLSGSSVSFSAGGASSGNDRDEYYAEAGRLVIDKDKASIGMLQRAFKLGFNRAARIVDQLADAGVVGEEDGTKPRKVLMSLAEFEESLKS